MSKPQTARRSGRIAALILTAQFILMGIAFLVLSSAINWPASLDDPAAISLPRIFKQAEAVRLGYSCYLVMALLLIPATAALNDRLGVKGQMAATTMALAVFSAMAKTIGIGRWLFAMPGLAEAYVAPGADHDAIATVFMALDSYAGGIGEVIGVGLMTGIWTLIIAGAVFVSQGPAAKVLGTAAFFAGLSLFLTIPAGFGVELGPVLTLSNVGWLATFLAIGLWCLRPVRRA